MAAKVTPETMFRCVHFSCLCAIRVCLERQQRRVRVANSGQLKAVFFPCGEVPCDQGIKNRNRFPNYQTKDQVRTSWGLKARR